MKRAFFVRVGWLLLGSAVFAAAFAGLTRTKSFPAGVVDGLTVAAMLLLCFGLFRLVGRMGQFDSTRFGYRKLGEIIKNKKFVSSDSEYATLADYRKAHPHEKPFLPLLAAAAIDFLAAIVCMYLCM